MLGPDQVKRGKRKWLDSGCILKTEQVLRFEIGYNSRVRTDCWGGACMQKLAQNFFLSVLASGWLDLSFGFISGLYTPAGQGPLVFCFFFFFYCFLKLKYI